MAETKTEYHTTPVGTARQCYVNEPSYKFNPGGVYSVKVEFDPKDISGLLERFNRDIEARLAEEIKKDPKIKKVIKSASPAQPVLDDEGDETGKVTLNFKRVHKQTWVDKKTGKEKSRTNFVKVIDTEGKVITEQVWSGSSVAARFFFDTYYIAKDKEVGVSLKLTHVLVADLVSSNGGVDPESDEDTSKLGFGKVDGFKTKGKSEGASEETEGAEGGSEEDDGAAF